jgi:hypothetical protein
MARLQKRWTTAGSRWRQIQAILPGMRKPQPGRPPLDRSLGAPGAHFVARDDVLSSGR